MKTHTTKLNNGAIVLADTNGDAKHYTNRSQARKAGMKQTETCYVRQSEYGNIFYVAFYEDPSIDQAAAL